MKENLLKKRKKKGFTLIELIVVIAILGILAAIAVPRLVGFTDKAKVSSDKELASIIAHSTSTLIASGDIKAQAGSITVTVASGALVFTPTTVANGSGTAYTAATLFSKLNPLVGDKVFQEITSATITITSDGEVPVGSITYAGD